MPKKYIQYLAFFLCASCSPFEKNNEQLYNSSSFTDIQYTDSLNFVSLNDELNKSLLKPWNIEIYDSILLIRDPDNGFEYKVVNVNTGKIINRFLETGKGPNQGLSTNIGTKFGAGKFQVILEANKRIYIYNIPDLIKTENPSPSEILYFEDFKIEDRESLRRAYFISDSIIIGLGLFNQSKLAAFSYRNNKVQRIKGVEFGYTVKDDRVKHKDELFITKYSAYNPNIITNGFNNHFIINHPSALYIEFCAIEHNEFRLYSSIQGHLPEYAVMNTGAAFYPNSKFGMFDGEMRENTSIFTYSGKSFSEGGTTSYFSNTVYEFDKTGLAINKYHLGRLICNISFDLTNRRIYGVSLHPELGEFEVGYFSY